MIFAKVEGMTKLNSSTPRYYESNKDNEEIFVIGDKSNYNEYIGEGVVEEFFIRLK